MGIVPYGKNQRCNNNVGTSIARPPAGAFRSYLRFQVISPLVILRDDVGIVPYGKNQRCNNDVGTTSGRPPVGAFHSYLRLNLSSMPVMLRATNEISPKGRCREATEGSRLRLRNAPTERFHEATEGSLLRQGIRPYVDKKRLHCSLFGFGYSVVPVNS